MAQFSTYTVQNLLVLVGFFCLSWIEHQWILDPHTDYLPFITFGFSIAMLTRFGCWVLPGVAAGHFISVLLIFNFDLMSALSTTLAIAISFYLCILVLRQQGFSYQLQAFNDLRLFILIGVFATPLIFTLLIAFFCSLDLFAAQHSLVADSVHILLAAIAGVLLFTTPFNALNLMRLRAFSETKVLFALVVMLVCFVEAFILRWTPEPALFLFPPVILVIWLADNTSLALTSLVSALYMTMVLLFEKSSLQQGPSLFPNEVIRWMYVCSMQAIAIYVSVRAHTIRKQLDLFEYSIRASRTGTWEWDLKTDIVTVNAEWNHMLGRAPTTTTHQQHVLASLVHPDDTALLEQAIDKTLSGEQNRFSETLRMQHTDGSWRFILSQGDITERDINDQPLRFYGTHTDVTEQHQNYDQLDALKRAADTSKTGIMLACNDEFFTLYYVNDAITEMTGFWADDLLLRPCWLMQTSEADQNFSAEQLIALRHGKRMAFTSRQTRRSGEIFWVQLVAEPVYNAQQQLSHILIMMSDITRDRRQNLSNEQQNELLRGLVNQVPVAMFQMQIDAQGHISFSYCSEKVSELFGASATQLKLESDLLFQSVDPDFTEALRASLVNARRAMSVWRHEFRVTRPNEGWRECHALPSVQDDGTVIWHGYFADITQSKNLQNSLTTLTEQLRLAQHTAQIGYWRYDIVNKEIYWSEFIYQMLGKTPQRRPFSLTNQLNLIHQADLKVVIDAFDALETKGSINIEYRMLMADGKVKWFHQFGDSTEVSNGHRQIQGMLQDITHYKSLELKLVTQALTDELTGIANRRAFVEQLEQEWNLFLRNKQENVSIILLDIDYFKRVNDNHGHEAGDEVLKHVTQVITSQIRKSDTFGRLGGEEFAIIVREAELQQATELAEKLRSRIEKAPLQLTRKLNIAVTASFGVSQFRLPSDGEPTEATDMLFAADKALYQAKNSGRNQVCQFIATSSTE